MSQVNHIVSVITPSYNSERFIQQTVESVINQTYQNWELIIIDDTSTDNTAEIVNQFCDKFPNIHLIRNTKNRGAAISRNKGVKAAKGSFIAFLDADDLWKPDKLEKQMEFMLKHQIKVCFSSYDLMDESGKLLNKTIEALPNLTYKKFLKCNYIGNLTGIYNAKKLGKIYAPNLRKRQDWLMWLEVVKQSNKPTLGMKESLAVYRVRQNSMSSNKLNLVKYNYLVYRKGLGFSFIKSLYRLIRFFIEYFFVKSKQTVTSPKT